MVSEHMRLNGPLKPTGEGATDEEDKDSLNSVAL